MELCFQPWPRWKTTLLPQPCLLWQCLASESCGLGVVERHVQGSKGLFPLGHSFGGKSDRYSAKLLFVTFISLRITMIRELQYFLLFQTPDKIAEAVGLVSDICRRMWVSPSCHQFATGLVSFKNKMMENSEASCKRWMKWVNDSSIACGTAWIHNSCVYTEKSWGKYKLVSNTRYGLKSFKRTFLSMQRTITSSATVTTGLWQYRPQLQLLPYGPQLQLAEDYNSIGHSYNCQRTITV